MYPICYWWVSGGSIWPELAMFSTCNHWFQAPSPPVWAQGNLRWSQGLIISPETRPERNWKGAASRRLERDMVGKLVGCWWKWWSELMGVPPHLWNPNNHSLPTNQQSARPSNGPQTLAGLCIRQLAHGPRSHWSSPFVVRFLLSLSTNSLTTHLGSVFTGYPRYDHSWTLFV